MARLFRIALPAVTARPGGSAAHNLRRNDREGKMKKKIAVLIVLAALLATAVPTAAYADMGPKPSVRIAFAQMGEELCYATLLSKTPSTGPGLRVERGGRGYPLRRSGTGDLARVRRVPRRRTASTFCRRHGAATRQRVSPGRTIRRRPSKCSSIIPRRIPSP